MHEKTLTAPRRWATAREVPRTEINAEQQPVTRKPYPGIRGIIEEGPLADLVLIAEIAPEADRITRVTQAEAGCLPFAPRPLSFPDERLQARRKASFKLPRAPRIQPVGD